MYKVRFKLLTASLNCSRSTACDVICSTIVSALISQSFLRSSPCRIFSRLNITCEC